MVVKTSQAKGAATPTAQRELLAIAYKLLAVPSTPRERRLDLLGELKANIHPETKYFLDITSRREIEHYELMEVLISKIPQLDSDHRQPHDFSKDQLFFFVAATYFDGGVQGADMKAFVDEELKRHYLLEPHHPEYELYHDSECPHEAIVEMSIDRLARNAQFSADGFISLDVVRKFLPKFPKGDSEAKQQLFWESALKYKDTVQETFFEVFPEARSWTSERVVQSTSPSERVVQSTSPSERVVQSTSPSERVVRSTSPSERVVQSTSPSERVVQSTSQSERVVQSTSPSDRVVQSTSPSERVVQSTSPSDRMVQSTSPSERVVQSTSPSERVVQSTSPSERVVQSTSQSDRVVQSISPSERVVQSTNPSDRAVQYTSPSKRHVIKPCTHTTVQVKG